MRRARIARMRFSRAVTGKGTTGIRGYESGRVRAFFLSQRRGGAEKTLGIGFGADRTPNHPTDRPQRLCASAVKNLDGSALQTLRLQMAEDLGHEGLAVEFGPGAVAGDADKHLRAGAAEAVAQRDLDEVARGMRVEKM